MADPDHFAILKAGVQAWNLWRHRHASVVPNLSGLSLDGVNFWKANLSKVNLSGSSLTEADLSWADLTGANLSEANLANAGLRRTILFAADLRNARIAHADLNNAILMNANLSGATLDCADLFKANLSDAILNGASLKQADLHSATLANAQCRGADFGGANLSSAILVDTDLQNANLSGARVHGLAAWNVNLSDTKQTDLVITAVDEPTLTVDNLEVAQFIYLLLTRDKIRQVIDAVTSKMVLILGRFTNERKRVLEAIRVALREHNYSPMLFDFDKPANRDLTETVSCLAHLSRFIVVDITDPRSVPHELQAIVPTLAIPVVPLLQSESEEYGMFRDLRKYPWVLQTQRYDDLADLLASLPHKIIAMAEAKAIELQAAKR